MCEILTTNHFNLNVWNALPDDPEEQLKFAVEKGLKVFLQKSEKLFSKYEVENAFGLTVLHRHYELSTGEIPLETFSSCQSITSPNSENLSNIIPHTWKLMRDEMGQIQLVPLEFMLISQPEQFCVQWENYLTFIHEFYSLLIEHQMHEVFGLHLLHRAKVLQLEKGVHLHETTITSTKESIVTAVSMAEMKTISQVEHVVPTLWEFGSADKAAQTCGGRWKCSYQDTDIQAQASQTCGGRWKCSYQDTDIQAQASQTCGGRWKCSYQDTDIQAQASQTCGVRWKCSYQDTDIQAQASQTCGGRWKCMN